MDYFPGTGKDRFKDSLNGKTTLPPIPYTERFGSAIVEKALEEPTEEVLLELFNRMKSAGVFTEAMAVAREHLSQAVEMLRELPFESSKVVEVMEGYVEGIFAKFKRLKV